MGQLTNKELKSASVTTLGKTAISYDRIKQALANEIFEKFPRAPLATLIWTFRMGKRPTVTEFELIIQNIKGVSD